MLSLPTKANLRVIALVAVVFKAAMWGLSMPLTKSLVGVYEPCTLGALRLAVALCVFLPILCVQRAFPLLTKETVVLGVTGVTLVQILQNTGMQTVSASSAVILLFGGVVVASAVLGRVLLGESCSRLVGAALVLSTIGVGIVAMNIRDGSENGFSMVGCALILAAALAFSIYSVLGKRVGSADLTALNAGILLVGFVALLPFAARESRPSMGSALDPRHLAALIVLGAAVSGASYFAWMFGLRHVPVAEANVLSSSEPVFGLVFAWLMLREHISMVDGVGALAIIGSCLLVTLRAPRPTVLVAQVGGETA